jgi:hypothetical protein
MGRFITAAGAKQRRTVTEQLNATYLWSFGSDASENVRDVE